MSAVPEPELCPCGCDKPLWVVLDGGIINPHMLQRAAAFLRASLFPPPGTVAAIDFSGRR